MRPRRARLVRLCETTFEARTGRTCFRFLVDGLEHRVHAIYHDPPALDPATWQACLEELAMACLVDISTASMAHSVHVPFFVDHSGRASFLRACTSLRLELLFDQSRSPALLPVQLHCGPRSSSARVRPRVRKDRVLLLMGGGKDSLYCYELLRKAGFDVRCFYVTEARRTWQQLRRVWSRLSNEVRQHRVYLDVNRMPELERTYQQGYLSQYQVGQVIAAALPYALAEECKYLALGIEKSSDEPMTSYAGYPLNHQDQKSTSAIRLLSRHLSWRLNEAVEIVSPVKGLYDFGIYARLLDTAPHLAFLQSSCGGANSMSAHCGRCHKCAFLAALLAGLTDDRSIRETLFKRSPLDRADAYAEWLDPRKHRPLTCAGLKDEVVIGLELAKRRGVQLPWFHAGSKPDSFLKNRLQWFLGIHENPLAPIAFQRRIQPLLKFDSGELVSVLCRSLVI